MDAPTVSRRIPPASQFGCAGNRWLAGWLAERRTRPRRKARREQARLTLHALGVQPFPLPSRHAKQRQCRLIKQASSQVERWYRDYVVMMTKAHRTRESVVPLGSRVPPLRKPSRMFHRHAAMVGTRLQRPMMELSLVQTQLPPSARDGGRTRRTLLGKEGLCSAKKDFARQKDFARFPSDRRRTRTSRTHPSSPTHAHSHDSSMP